MNEEHDAALFALDPLRARQGRGIRRARQAELARVSEDVATQGFTRLEGLRRNRSRGNERGEAESTEESGPAHVESVGNEETKGRSAVGGERVRGSPLQAAFQCVWQGRSEAEKEGPGSTGGGEDPAAGNERS